MPMLIRKLVEVSFVIVLVAVVPALSYRTSRRPEILALPRLQLYLSAAMSQWVLSTLGVVVPPSLVLITIGSVTGQVGALPTASTPWIESTGSYTAECSSTPTADVLEITAQGGAPTLKAVPDPSWGLHLVDANIALGNLTALVHAEANAYAGHHRM